MAQSQTTTLMASTNASNDFFGHIFHRAHWYGPRTMPKREFKRLAHAKDATTFRLDYDAQNIIDLVKRALREDHAYTRMVGTYTHTVTGLGFVVGYKYRGKTARKLYCYKVVYDVIETSWGWDVTITTAYPTPH